MKADKKSVRGRRDEPSRGPDSISGSDDGSLYSLTSEDRDVMNAKMFLMTQQDPDQPSLYEHLSGLITRVLEDGSENALKELEDVSQSMRLERMAPNSQLLRNNVPKTAQETLAHAQWTMFKKEREAVVEDVAIDPEQIEDDGDKFKGVPDILRQAAFFELAGVGLPREENVRISLALSDLVEANPTVKSIRFWGKILGISRNYYVAEAEFGENDYADDNTMAGEHENEDFPGELREEDSSLLDDLMLQEDLKPMHKPPPKIPCEPAGHGLNKKVFYVASEPGLPWIRLPHVTPAQIQAARKIRKMFSGNLDAQVIAHPPFPGVERNYLRAQIARITASTHISPLGYFRFDDEGEEEEEHEEGGGRAKIVVDADFEGIPTRDLTDFSMQGWVHHSQAILPQGRTTWWNPVQQNRGEMNENEDEEDEEERNEPDEPEPEIGPPLLTPVSEDDNVGMTPPWIPATSSKFVPEYSIATMQSNVWHGAYAFATEKGKYFENIYVGWGMKNLESNFDPALPEMPLPEFPSGPEITESDDPTPEEEAAVRAALQEKQLEAEMEQGIRDDEEEGEEEGEEE